MEYPELKRSVEAIEMPPEMRERIASNCRMAAAQTQYQEDFTVKKQKSYKRPVTIAVAVALCLCLSVGVMAATNTGFFKNITNPVGTVTGSEYVQATEEIQVTVTADEGELTVLAVVSDPNAFPYRECAALSIGSYRILDATGNVVAEGSNTDSSLLTDGQAELTIPLSDLDSGDYKLVIEAFVGSKKADQPLSITGFWESGFTV